MFKTGQAMLEMIVAIGVMAVFLPAVALAVGISKESQLHAKQRTYASISAKQDLELIEHISKDAWHTLTDGEHQVVLSGQSIGLHESAASESANGLRRKVLIESVYRDDVGRIVDSGGSMDPATKRVTASVEWANPRPSSVRFVQYFTRTTNNQVVVHTTAQDFATGVFENTRVDETNNAVVQLDDSFIGTFTSPVIDLGQVASVHRVFFLSSERDQTNTKVQIASNTDNNRWDFLGPDGTSTSYYIAEGGPIPLAAVEARFIRYKVLFESTGSELPYLSELGFQYSL